MDGEALHKNYFKSNKVSPLRWHSRQGWRGEMSEGQRAEAAVTVVY
jgi:hypothetical protein